MQYKSETSVQELIFFSEKDHYIQHKLQKKRTKNGKISNNRLKNQK